MARKVTTSLQWASCGQEAVDSERDFTCDEDTNVYDQKSFVMVCQMDQAMEGPAGGGGGEGK